MLLCVLDEAVIAEEMKDIINEDDEEVVEKSRGEKRKHNSEEEDEEDSRPVRVVSFLSRFSKKTGYCNAEVDGRAGVVTGWRQLLVSAQ
jgi:hypothetical protein